MSTEPPPAPAPAPAPALEVGVGVWTLENTVEHPHDWHDLYAGARRMARHAERLGFESMWFAEHHHVYSGYLPAQFPVFAACAAVTERMRMCGGVTLLPLNGSERIADGSAAMDAIAPGRLRLALALGYVEREFRAAGIDRRTRARLFESHLQQLLALPQERVGNTEFWVGAHKDAPIRRAARFGCPLYLQQIFDPAELRRIRNLWESEFQPHSHNRPCIGLLAPIWAHENGASVARARARWDSMGRHYAHHIMTDVTDLSAAGIDMSAGETFVAGNCHYIVDRLAALVERGGVDALFLFVQTPDAAEPEVADQLALLSAEVVPHLRRLR